MQDTLLSLLEKYLTKLLKKAADMKKQAVILDSDEEFVRRLYKNIRTLISKYGVTFEIDTFSHPDEMEKSKKIYHLAFMETVFSGKDAVYAARKWKNTGRVESVIYVSAHEKKVFQTFESSPIYFVRKAHLDKDLENAFCLYLRTLQLSQVLIPEGAGYQLWNADEIIYLKSRGHYIDGQGKDGRKYLIRGKLDDIQPILEPHGFVRIQLRCLVNIKYITIIKPQYIQLENGEKYRISHPCFESLASKLLPACGKHK